MVVGKCSNAVCSVNQQLNTKIMSDVQHVARHCISRDWPNYVTFGKAPRVYAVSVECKMINYACLQKRLDGAGHVCGWGGGVLNV